MMVERPCKRNPLEILRSLCDVASGVDREWAGWMSETLVLGEQKGFSKDQVRSCAYQTQEGAIFNLIS